MYASTWTQLLPVIGVLALVLLAVGLLFGPRLRRLVVKVPGLTVSAEGDPAPQTKPLPPQPAPFGEVPTTIRSTPVPSPDPTPDPGPVSGMDESEFMSESYLAAFGGELKRIADASGDDLDFFEKPVDQLNIPDRPVQRRQ